MWLSGILGLVAWSPSGQHYKITMSAHCHKFCWCPCWYDFRMSNNNQSIVMTTTNITMPTYGGRVQAFHAGGQQFGSRSSQKPLTYKIDTCCFQGWYALDSRLAQHQDSVTAWNIGSGCWWPDFPVGQYCKVALSAQSHQSVHIPIWPLLLPWRKIPTTNRYNHNQHMLFYLCKFV